MPLTATVYGGELTGSAEARGCRFPQCPFVHAGVGQGVRLCSAGFPPIAFRLFAFLLLCTVFVWCVRTYDW